MRKLSLLLLLLVVPTSVFAQTWRDRDRDRDRRDRYYRRDNRFELTPLLGYTWGGTIFADTTDLFGRDVQAASHANFGVNFGIPLGMTNNMKLELMVNRQDTQLTKGTDGLFRPDDRIANFHVTYYQAGLMIPFSESRNATPFFVVGAGVGNLDPQISGVSASNRFAANAGVGVKVPVNQNLGVRLETRGYFTSVTNGNNNCRRCTDTSNHDFYQGEVNLGFVISF